MPNRASKTRMFSLLRLLDQGSLREDQIRAAWICWQDLSEEDREAMITSHHANAADLRRIRLWSAAWDGGMDYILTALEEAQGHV